MTEKAAPQSIDTEEMALGAMFADPEAVTVGVGMLEPEDFYSPIHSKVFTAIRTLSGRNEKVELQSVKAELERSGKIKQMGGITALMRIEESQFSGANIEGHCNIVREKSMLRKMAAFGAQLSERCHNGAGNLDDLIISSRETLEGLSATATARRSYVSVRMDKVPRETIEWLWKPWLPLGKLAILDGDPKTGKTTLALQFAAILSQGWPFPGKDGRPGDKQDPANSVILCAEDGLGDTLGPRLDTAEADCARIEAMTGIRVREGAKLKDQMVTLADVEQIEALVVDTKAKFLIVDPIQAYIGSKVNTDKANETRPVLQALAALAARQKCSVLIIRHRRKAGGSALEGGMGSVDFTAAARSVMVAVRDPDEPKTKRVLAHTACNLALESDSLKYEIQEPDAKFVWGGLDTRTADEVCEKPKGKPKPEATPEDAETFLKNLLLNERRASNEVKAKAHREGIKPHVLLKAKDRLGVEVTKVGALWFWSLPEFPPIQCTEEGVI